MDSGAGLLHRLTSYTPDRDWDVPVDDPRVRHDLISNDMATVPPFMKGYPAGLPAIALPRDLPDPGVSATAVLAGVPAPAQPLDAAQLGRVLFLGAGVVRTKSWHGRSFLFRASGSAGARFPLEVYASTRGVAGVPDGVHWYDGAEHALVQVGPAANGEVTTLVVTGVPWRTGWRYAERGWRHLYWDAGTLLSQLSAAAASAGFAPRLRSRFPDAAVRELVGADGVHEYPVALLSFGDGRAGDRFHRCGGDGRAAPGRAAALHRRAARWGAGRGRAAVVRTGAVGRPGVRLARRRGPSARIAAAHGQVADAAACAAGMADDRGDARHRGAALGRRPRRRRRGARDLPVARPVDAAAGRGPSRRAGADLPGPDARGADAAYVVIGATPLSTLDDRGYRDAQLAAGLVEGRLHLAAYALGASATGMTFLDSEVPALLGEPDDLATLLFTCVGVPEYASRAGGGPGAPVEIRPVAERFKDE